MQVLETIDEMRAYTRECRQAGRDIGFVPTMGALHEGHLSLIHYSAEENDTTVVSIFVNPTQFMPGEDFDNYPRMLEEDIQKAASAGAEAVFAPSAEEIYGSNGECLTSVFVWKLSEKLCGMSRGPGHFRGVCTIVTKLFNIVQPDRAYFGQKDAQQALILGRMVQDLNMPVEMNVCPTRREADGLAMSSRNKYLDEEMRNKATALYKALSEGREMLHTGEQTSMLIMETMYEELARHEGVEIDYLEIVEPASLEPVEWIESTVLIAGAVKIGAVRLIDNILVHPEHGPWEG